MIFLIPARAGSKRLPGKNKRLFCGLPLWLWSAACARRHMLAGDQLLVSTDDGQILSQANALGIPVHWRTPELAADDSPTIALIEAIFAAYPAERYIVLLQPTSPDRFDHEVAQALDLARCRSGSVVAVLDRPPRNSGSLYIYDREHIPDAEWSNAVQIPGYASDIDDLEDFQHAEAAFRQRAWS